MKIRKLLVFLIIGISLSSLIIISITYMSVFKNQIDKYSSKSLQTATVIQYSLLECFFSERESDIKTLALDPCLKSFMNDINKFPKHNGNPVLKQQIQNTINIYKHNISSLKDISIINTSGIIVAATEIKDIGKKTYLPSLEYYYPNKVYYSNIIKDKPETYMIISIPLYNEKFYTGCLVFKLSMEYFKKMIVKVDFFETGTSMILDNNGEIAATNSTYKDRFTNIYNIPNNLLSNLSSTWAKNLYPNNKNDVFNYYINGEKKLYYYKTLPQNGWTVFCSIQSAEYKAFFNQTGIIALAVIMLMIIIGCYFFIKNFFSKPLENLVDDIHQMKNSDNKQRFTYTKHNEFGEITAAFNSLMDKIEADTNELKVSEERYKIVLEQTKDIVIDWDIIKDVAYHSPQWTEIFGHTALKEKFLGSYPNGIHVVEEDKPIFYSLFSQIAAGAASGKAEYRIYNIHGEKVWCKVLLKTIFNENGEAVRAIGIVTDITTQKAEIAQLKTRAELDPLTKLYNKGTTEQMIQDYLNKTDESIKHALMVIDVDDFKSVNDELGHLKGDSVLAEITAKIHKYFRSYDIVGRIGGDEFIVFIKNLDTIETLKNKAIQLTNKFNNYYCDDKKTKCVTISIGIAVYPNHGTTYEELFANADAALYEAKKAGKNRYRIYKKQS